MEIQKNRQQKEIDQFAGYQDNFKSTTKNSKAIIYIQNLPVDKNTTLGFWMKRIFEIEESYCIVACKLIDKSTLILTCSTHAEKFKLAGKVIDLLPKRCVVGGRKQKAPPKQKDTLCQTKSEQPKKVPIQIIKRDQSIGAGGFLKGLNFFQAWKPLAGFYQ